MGWISENRYLTLDEMKNNALLVTSYLRNRGWTDNAIAGILGNMQRESTINPGIWQNLDKGNYNVGFGLVQWTPASNFIDWADYNGYTYTDGNAQLEWICQETVTSGQWIETEEYPRSFSWFYTSTASPRTLASVFLYNFERAGVAAEQERRDNAAFWYEYITEGEIPDDPSVNPKPKKKKFNFLLFNKQRRTIV